MRKFLFLSLITAMLCTLSFPVRAADLQVAGKSALLMDATTGTILYESNAHEKLAPASVTKIMTMLLIMEAVDSGKIAMTDTVTASETAAGKGGSQIYLKAGETMSVSDMLKSIAVSSANDCACAMAEHIAGSEEAFVAMMNRRAEELGMADTHFVNCTGLDDGPDGSNHKTSAYDIALMSRQLLKYHPDIKQFTTIWMDTVRNGTFGLSNTNKLIRFYSGATGLKTGFTSGAGYCLSASALRDGMELIAVVMGAQTSAERNTACKQLLDYGFANFSLYTPELSQMESVPVKLGKAKSVSLRLGEEAQLLIDKSQKSGITAEVIQEPSVCAPISLGQRLGTLTIRSGEQILTQIPLVAAEPVERLQWKDLFALVFGRASMAEVSPQMRQIPPASVQPVNK
ncbi:MAG: D-alanyl-D-alanine carboxypeptidase [Oscillospiraceae bacterium]|nr:D-alanyl-D-alanine carboxypeptidase [Oscillospiraceae bacterium]